MKRYISLAALLTSATLASPALAADLYTKVPLAGSAAPSAGWSGVYVGVEGGYGWGHQHSELSLSDGNGYGGPFLGFNGASFQFVNGPAVSVGSIKERGWLFGGFFGAQKQLGNWVLGVEADIDAAGLKGSVTSSASSTYALQLDPQLCTNCAPGDTVMFRRGLTMQSKIDELGSLRGKVGFAPAQNWLIYGTGGLAFAHATNTVAATETVSTNGITSETGTQVTSGGATMFGWAAGGGIDWKFTADPSVIVGLGYTHYQFPTNTINLTDNAGTMHAINSRQSIDTVKLRLSYLLGIH